MLADPRSAVKNVVNWIHWANESSMRCLTDTQSGINKPDENAAEDNPAPQQQRYARHDFSVARRNVRRYRPTVNRVMKYDGRYKENHLDEKGPVEIVHVRVRREQ